ncbi:MAG: peptidylprolyl isomerase [Alphaproteobacteria bacterium]|nr:peptidylprolyl isomerase [Alphaproteobacteria bacterium]
MAQKSAPKARILGGLAFAFVLLFVVYVAYDAWLKPAPVEVVPSGETTEQLLAVLELEDGPVEIELLPERAPKAVERITTLIDKGFYDGIVFHRVIAGFMAQTGDPTGTGTGGSDLPDLPAEFSDEPFVRGVIGMARTPDPNSANSQFFIMYAPAPNLDGQYTVVGKVVSGMEHVDAIKKGDPSTNGLVTDPDKIVSFRLKTE